MDRITLGKITDRIMARVENTLDRPAVFDAVRIISNEIKQALLRDDIVFVKNFGTLSVIEKDFNYAMHEIQTGKYSVHGKKRRIHFYISKSMKRLLAEKKQRLSEKLLDNYEKDE